MGGREGLLLAVLFPKEQIIAAFHFKLVGLIMNVVLFLTESVTFPHGNP